LIGVGAGVLGFGTKVQVVKSIATRTSGFFMNLL
jgi:hypothetical protein